MRMTHILLHTAHVLCVICDMNSVIECVGFVCVIDRIGTTKKGIGPAYSCKVSFHMCQLKTLCINYVTSRDLLRFVCL